jgi:hypothetical protein
MAVGVDGPATLTVAGYGAFEFCSPVEARDEAVRLSRLVAAVRDGLEREGFCTCRLSDAAILCGLDSGGFRISGSEIEPWTG